MKYAPIEMSDIDIAFGGKAMKILPPMVEIPDEFSNTSNQWAKWQADWFYSGLSAYPVPKEGIDLELAMRNLKAVQGSFTPKHEHKAAGVAYLASLWFERPDGQPIKVAA
jgi:anti-sigma factor ChrR (cupin superfamily)